MANPRNIRQLSADELLVEIAEAEAEALEHAKAEGQATTEEEESYHWGRKATARVYAQLCREELQRRYP